MGTGKVNGWTGRWIDGWMNGYMYMAWWISSENIDCNVLDLFMLFLSGVRIGKARRPPMNCSSFYFINETEKKKRFSTWLLGSVHGYNHVISSQLNEVMSSSTKRVSLTIQELINGEGPSYNQNLSLKSSVKWKSFNNFWIPLSLGSLRVS